MVRTPLDPAPEPEASPGPDDVVTIKTGGNHSPDEAPVIERGKGEKTHPMGSKYEPPVEKDIKR